MIRFHRHYHRIAKTIPANLAQYAGLTGRWSENGVALVVSPRGGAAETYAQWLADIREQAREVAEACALLGMPWCAGLVLMNNHAWSAPRAWDSAPWWAQKAEELAALKAALQEFGGYRSHPGLLLVPLDIEDYNGPLAAEPNPAACATAMAPFLAQLVGIEPAIYPASVHRGNGKVCLATIVEASTHAEIWGEEAFGRVDIERLGSVSGGAPSPAEVANQSAINRLRAEAYRRWGSKVSVFQGVTDRAWRTCFTSDAAFAEMTGPDVEARWIFDKDRVAGKSDLAIGTPPWISGTTIHSVMDARHVWTLLPTDEDGARAPSGIALSPKGVALVDDYPAEHLRSKLGWMQRGARGLLALDVIPKTAPFSVLWRGSVDQARRGPVISGCTGNGRSWQLVHVDGRFELDIIRPVAGPPQLGYVPILKNADAIVLTRSGTRWTAYTDVGTYELDPGWAVNALRHLWVGIGNDITMRAAPIASPGLITSEVAVWDRALSRDEALKALASPFPWK